MFTNTITITIDSVGKVLNRINQDGYSSEYFLREATGEFRLKLRHVSYMDKSRGVAIDRHTVELVQVVYPVSPATVSTQRKMYTVLENERSDTGAAPVNFGLGLAAFLTSGNLTQLVNWES